jgi:hypothetical protein
LASSRPSSHGVDWKDIADALRAFQEQNSVIITIGIVTVDQKGLPDLIVDAQAWEKQAKPTDPVLLASANARCSALNVRTLEAACFQLLYQLDSQLALRELGDAYKSG